MILGIDLHNIRDGGGVNYVRNLLLAADPKRDRLQRVHLFASPENLANFPDRPFVEKHGFAALSGGLPSRLLCAFGALPRRARQLGCDLLYAPGGIAFGQFRPFATISRNMMPFRKDLWALYPSGSPERMRLHILNRLNAQTFARADGTIFLTHGAQAAITPYLPGRPPHTAVIAHGVDHALFKPRERRPIPAADEEIRLAYPSRLEPYKHQVEVLEAVAGLRGEFPRLRIDFSGPANPDYLLRFNQARARLDPRNEYAVYLGNIPGTELPALYARSDLLVFASSCENLPNILIEAMSCAIPIVSSHADPMPEVAGEAALYLDPAAPDSIADSIRAAISDPAATQERTALGLVRSRGFSWQRCAEQTFRFLAQVAGSATANEEELAA